MNGYCRIVRPTWQIKSRPQSFEDLATLSAFLRQIRYRWVAIDPSTVPDERRLDRFLMMYGKALKPRKRRTIGPCQVPLGAAE
jgi:hypothetical protein